MEIETLAGWLIPIVAMICVFTFVAIAAWSENRLKEREAYYRHETYRKLADGQGSSQEVLELMREEERARARRLRDGLLLGGLITGVSGLGVMIFLYVIVEVKGVFLVGLIPLLIGLVLTLFALFKKPPTQEA